MRKILRDRRTFAAVLVAIMLGSVLIGSLRDDEPDDTAEDPPVGTPTIHVTPGTPSGSASPGDEPDEEQQDEASGPAYPTAVAPARPETDPASGLPVVALADLPPEATATVELIDSGGPFPYADDGEAFLNSAGRLPQREAGYYRVYTVDTPGSAEPTARRIVTGSDGELYWTDDHYESFRRIRR